MQDFYESAATFTLNLLHLIRVDWWMGGLLIHRNKLSLQIHDSSWDTKRNVLFECSVQFNEMLTSLRHDPSGVQAVAVKAPKALSFVVRAI